MSVYRRFERHDILFSTINTRPRVSVAYGSGSWRGSTGDSGSLSLYGGIRGRRDVKPSDTSGLKIYPIDPVDTHSIDKVIFVSGSYPSTGSIRLFRCRDQEGVENNETQWYEEHFKPIELLYDYYSGLDSCYFTGSYDKYCMYLPADHTSSIHTSNAVVYYGGSGQYSGISAPGRSWTAEIWYKPALGTTSFERFVMSQPDAWGVVVSADNRLELFNVADGTYTVGSSPNVVTDGFWHHLAVAVSGGISASFYVDGVLTAVSGVSAFASGTNPFMTLGAMAGGDSFVSGCDGFIFESRLWSSYRSAAQIASDMSSTLDNATAQSNLLLYARLNDGPRQFNYPVLGMGTGTVDWSSFGQSDPLTNFGQINSLLNPLFAGHWNPNDHPTFQTQRVLAQATGALNDVRVIHIPSMFYGKQIEPGSVVINDGVWNARKIVRTFNDDGRGCLYLSGSMTRTISGEEYTGDTRHKVGNVFYSEGLIVFTDPALWDMFDPASIFWIPSIAVASGTFPDLLSVDFNGQGKVYTKTFNCRMPTAQVNASNNPTFTELDDRGTSDLDDDVRRVVRDDGTIYVTAIGLYNEDRTLVAVAKLAQPLRKREKDKQNIRLKMDF